MNTIDQYSPFLLLSFDNSKSWIVTNEAKAILSSFSKDRPLKVIGVAGPMRTGKSYLMNRIAGVQKGFVIGPMVEGCTRGIWGWMINRDSIDVNTNKKQPYDTLIIDTEGMYDPKRHDPVIDQQLFVAAILLSSLVIYNTVGVINEDTIGKLSFVTNLSEIIMVKVGNTKKDNFKTFKKLFPSFLWVVRDFILDLSQHGDSMGYLLHTLTLGEYDGSAETETSNLIRRNIKEFFASLDCMTIAPPGLEPRDLRQVDDIPFEYLSGQFRSDITEVVKKIHETAAPKRLFNPSSVEMDQSSAVNMTTSTFIDYAMAICDAFNADGIPKLDTMWEAASRRACQDALVAAKEVFDLELIVIFGRLVEGRIEEHKGIPFNFTGMLIPFNDTEKEFNELLILAQSKCIETFTPLAMGPFYDSTKKEIEAYINDGIENARTKNFKLSEEICKLASITALNHLNSRIDNEEFDSFEAFSDAQNFAVDAFQYAASEKGPAYIFELQKGQQIFETIREAQRLKFNVSQAQRERDEAEFKLFEERKKSDLEKIRMNEALQKQREQFERDQELLRSEQAEMMLRLKQQERDTIAQEKLFQDKIKTMIEHGEKEKAEFEIKIKAEQKAILDKATAEFQSKIKDLGDQVLNHQDTCKNLQSTIENLQKEPKVINHYHPAKESSSFCIIS
eukprot:gene24597-32032_t